MVMEPELFFLHLLTSQKILINLKKSPAIIFTHLEGGVNEQTAGLYSKKIAEAGQLVIITFDAYYHGESTAEPHQLKNPYTRAEIFMLLLIT